MNRIVLNKYNVCHNHLVRLKTKCKYLLDCTCVGNSSFSVRNFLCYVIADFHFNFENLPLTRRCVKQNSKWLSHILGPWVYIYLFLVIKLNTNPGAVRNIAHVINNSKPVGFKIQRLSSNKLNTIRWVLNMDRIFKGKNMKHRMTSAWKDFLLLTLKRKPHGKR